MTIEIRHAWLQKHPSPVAARGEFHWYPAEGDRELRASLVERARGGEAPAVLWELGPGRVSWARGFAATAPVDGRRYVGLVVSTAECAGATPAELLDALVVPPAAPWCEASGWGDGLARELGGRAEPHGRGPARGGAGADVGGEPAGCGADRRAGGAGPWRGAAAHGRPHDAERRGDGADVSDVARRSRRTDAAASGAEVAAIARALLSGGDAVLPDPERGDLPGLVASVERWMPPAITARARRGAWRGGAVMTTPDRVTGLIAAAWREPGARAAQAWRLLCELAAGREVGVDEIVAELGASERPGAALTDAERAALGGGCDFAGTLHAWGRGRLDGAERAATLPARLADAAALRVLACLMADRDPRGVIAEVRWHALLPGARRATLLGAMVERAASLRAFLEVPHE